MKSFAIPIVNLRVSREWRVGRVWLRRPEWLLARIEATRAAPGTTHNEVLKRLAVEARELPWVLAVAEAATDEEARAIVEEHIAVLRLYALSLPVRLPRPSDVRPAPDNPADLGKLLRARGRDRHQGRVYAVGRA